MATKQPTAYPLRMPDELRFMLELEAKGRGWSLNQEIVARLEQSNEEGHKLPELVTKTIQKSIEGTDVTFEDALMKYVAVGMREAPMRAAAAEALRAEKHRSLAFEQTVGRCKLALSQALKALETERISPETAEDLISNLRALLRDIAVLERPIL